MNKEILNAVGIPARTDIPVGQLFSKVMDPAIYGLEASSLNRISALRDFVQAYNSEIPVRSDSPVVNSDDASGLLYGTLRQLDHEEIWVILVNSANYPITKKRIAIGSLDSAIIDVRSVIKEALNSDASGVILAHNHPSGNPTPSAADIRQTEVLGKALKVFEIALLDHIVISDTCYFSFTESKTRNYLKR